MATKIFVNLPVKDLNKSMDFFGKLGYTFNPQYTNEQAACMIVSEDIYYMLLTEPFFKGFIKKEIADATKTTEVINCLSTDSRQEVDDIIGKATAGGATPYPEAKDYGFMYSHGFEDLDGHLWEYVFMDPNAAPPHEG
ncbi:glyoxalase/bleomycin resistance/extradiol dioxygenase family protein [Chitinophaga agrisoli]|uniref:Glyoxalase/bleomycin resistance/extradiol dioxygenase family protein n=1 Tax=Chitinophaga agrisoli TaxID=2607653 RepID=A0A5B2VIN2_9BACT|nr:VOC family protein [Chitinophaga agrisoli]KAA2238921.1 glyoxalase/bleomycin resistance/extradiol dioxygenase family protein [Chitinophaga agrisoli]